MEMVRELLGLGMDPNQWLGAAVEAQSIRVLEELLATRPNPAYYTLPLLIAVRIGRIDCAEALLRAGADPDLGIPMRAAIINKSLPMVDLLLRYGAETGSSPL